MNDALVAAKGVKYAGKGASKIPITDVYRRVIWLYILVSIQIVCENVIYFSSMNPDAYDTTSFLLQRIVSVVKLYFYFYYSLSIEYFVFENKNIYNFLTWLVFSSCLALFSLIKCFCCRLCMCPDATQRRRANEWDPELKRYSFWKQTFAFLNFINGLICFFVALMIEDYWGLLSTFLSLIGCLISCMLYCYMKMSIFFFKTTGAWGRQCFGLKVLFVDDRLLRTWHFGKRKLCGSCKLKYF